MITTRKIAIDTLSDIAKSTNDKAALAHLRRLKRRFSAKPMAKILSAVPGDTIATKAKALGVTRTTYYSWLGGLTRPRGKTAAKLADITGYRVDVIRGRGA